MKNRKKIEDLKIEVKGMRELWLLAEATGNTEECDNINNMIVETQKLIRKLETNGEPSEPR
jgi:hypothetical protein